VPRGFLRHVAFADQGADAARFDVARRLLRGGTTAMVEHDIGAVCGKLHRDGPSNAAADP
jgi:hypothetical protein